MGFSVLDGLVMGTRSGSLDPGVVLWLADERGIRRATIEKLLYDQSGLLGVSGVSADMRTLLPRSEPRARLAVDLFVYRIGRELGSLAAALGGIDAVVFTGGIGENAAVDPRSASVAARAGSGSSSTPAANTAGGPASASIASRVSAFVVGTDEELMIARHARRLLPRAASTAGDTVSTKPALSEAASLSAYGQARATVEGAPLTPEEVSRLDAFWRACNYLSLGMIYLRDNPLLQRAPRSPSTSRAGCSDTGVRARRCRSCGPTSTASSRRATSTPSSWRGQAMARRACSGRCYLEGTYTEVYPDKSLDEEGLKRFFKQFSFPGGIGSHATPETPGSDPRGRRARLRAVPCLRRRLRQPRPHRGRGGR